MRPIIIDTDIGSDVDDAIAITYALKQGLDVKLITTVHGPTNIRADIAKKLTTELGYEIPIAAGLKKPIKQRLIYTTGLEGKDFVPQTDEDRYPNAIKKLEEVLTKDICDIVAIGPLTNIATLLQQKPEMKSRIGHIYMMGNAIQYDNQYFINYRAHNFKVDPEAVDIIFGTDIPKTIVTTEVCKQNSLTRNQLKELRGTVVGDYICNAAISGLDFIGYENAHLYDPLVVEHLLDENVTSRKVYNEVSITQNVKESFSDKVFQTLKDI